MESLRDERGNLHALIPHSQACFSRFLLSAPESGLLYTVKRMVSSAEHPASTERSAVRYVCQLLQVRLFNPSARSVRYRTALAE